MFFIVIYKCYLYAYFYVKTQIEIVTKQIDSKKEIFLEIGTKNEFARYFLFCLTYRSELRVTTWRHSSLQGKWRANDLTDESSELNSMG